MQPSLTANPPERWSVVLVDDAVALERQQGDRKAVLLMQRLGDQFAPAGSPKPVAWVCLLVSRQTALIGCCCHGRQASAVVQGHERELGASPAVAHLAGLAEHGSSGLLVQFAVASRRRLLGDVE